MRAIFEGLVLSLGYFSQIHLPYRVQKVIPRVYGFMALSLPFVGMLLGILTVAIYLFVSSLFDDVYGGVFAAIVYMALYGFIHLEGMSDIIDAYYAKHSGKEVYTVLKDPTIGALGAIGTFCFILLKSLVLFYLFRSQLFYGVIVGMGLSRLMAVVLIYLASFHSGSTFIMKMKKGISLQAFWAVVCVVAMMSMLVSFTLFLLALVVTYILYIWLQKNIGFLNGDGLGFVIEIIEWVLFNIFFFLSM